MTHSFEVRLSVPTLFGGGEQAGGVMVGFMMRDGRRIMLGLTSTVSVGEVAAGVDAALADMVEVIASSELWLLH